MNRGTPSHGRAEQVHVEFLFLDLETCTRCRGTEANLMAAIEEVADRLRDAGTEVLIDRIHVSTAELARRHRFLASPTLRVNGRDIAMELRETPCDSCGERCGCEGGVSCRVWSWRGQEHRQAPTAMIVEAILQAIDDPRPAENAPAYNLPENLRRYYAGVAQKAREAAEPQCCDTENCCPPGASSTCCAQTTEDPNMEAQTCGCH
jgi:hypothetical protein